MRTEPSAAAAGLDYSPPPLLVLDRIEQQHDSSPLIREQHYLLAQIQPKPLGDPDRSAIPDRVAVIIVDVLELSMFKTASAN